MINSTIFKSDAIIKCRIAESFKASKIDVFRNYRFDRPIAYNNPTFVMTPIFLMLVKQASTKDKIPLEKTIIWLQFLVSSAISFSKYSSLNIIFCTETDLKIPLEKKIDSSN